MEREGHESDRAFYLEAWNGTGCVHVRSDRPRHVADRGRLQSASSGGSSRARSARTCARPSAEELGRRPDPAVPARGLPRRQRGPGERRSLARHRRAPARVRAVPGARQALPRRRRRARGAQRATNARSCGSRPRRRTSLISGGGTGTPRPSSRSDPALISHCSKYRSLMPSLALIFHVIEAVTRGTGGPVSLAAAERAMAWCDYLAANAADLRDPDGVGHGGHPSRRAHQPGDGRNSVHAGTFSARAGSA